MPTHELLTRAVEEVVPKPLAEEKLKSGKKMRLYLGIDPTGSKLHLGHSVPLRKLQAFAEAGHEVIFLVGSFTAMIGDPSGRDVLREPLSKEQVEANFQTYKKQAGKVLDFSKVTIRYNDEWLGKLTYNQVVEHASHFTVQQMEKRDMFAERLKNDTPISVHEFLYPLMVGYDSVVLDVDCEIGGNDQLFNMLCGRTMQKAYGKRDKFVLTTKLIEGTDGRKMSKTYDNCIWLEDSAKDMYGKTMSIEDRLITTYMECCTDISMEEIAEAKKSLKKNENPIVFKRKLAFEIVKLYFDEETANQIQNEFIRGDMISRKTVTESVIEIIPFKEWDENKRKQWREEIFNVDLHKDILLIEAMLYYKLVSSKSEAKRLIEQNGVELNGKKITSIDTLADVGNIKVGKLTLHGLKYFLGSNIHCDSGGHLHLTVKPLRQSYKELALANALMDATLYMIEKGYAQSTIGISENILTNHFLILLKKKFISYSETKHGELEVEVSLGEYLKEFDAVKSYSVERDKAIEMVKHEKLSGNNWLSNLECPRCKEKELSAAYNNGFSTDKNQKHNINGVCHSCKFKFNELA